MADLRPEGDIILVVDDSPETLGFLTEALEADGATVLVARSGEQGLNIVEKLLPDVVLMDAVMPGLDGFETCRRLKQKPQAAHVPVIFMTGLTETEHVVHALDCGGVDYLNKPINVDELRARMRVHRANARSALGAQVALDAAGRHLLAVSRGGKILWSTPQTGKLLQPGSGVGSPMSVLPDRFRAWFSTFGQSAQLSGESLLLDPDDAGSIQFVHIGTIGEDEHLFRVIVAQDDNQDEALKQHFGLTQRESEVLLWIARGKSNRDIGDILGLSPRTVNKHLEQVYVKLGVENRASAAVKATHVLQSAFNG